MPDHQDSISPQGTARDRLVAVQAALGLAPPTLAAALHVSNTRLYQLMSPDAGVRQLLQPEAARIDAVERVAKAWAARTTAPMRAVAHLPVADGRTGVDLLAAETISEQGLSAALDELLAMLEAQPKSRSQLMRESGYRRRPSVRALPSDA